MSFVPSGLRSTSRSAGSAFRTEATRLRDTGGHLDHRLASGSSAPAGVLARRGAGANRRQGFWTSASGRNWKRVCQRSPSGLFLVRRGMRWNPRRRLSRRSCTRRRSFIFQICAETGGTSVLSRLSNACRAGIPAERLSYCFGRSAGVTSGRNAPIGYDPEQILKVQSKIALGVASRLGQPDGVIHETMRQDLENHRDLGMDQRLPPMRWAGRARRRRRFW